MTLRSKQSTTSSTTTNSTIDSTIDSTAAISTIVSTAIAAPSRSMPSCKDLLSGLPDELLLRTFAFHSEADLSALSCVTKQFYELSSHNELWSTLYSTTWGSSLEATMQSPKRKRSNTDSQSKPSSLGNTGVCWKAKFRANHFCEKRELGFSRVEAKWLMMNIVTILKPMELFRRSTTITLEKLTDEMTLLGSHFTGFFANIQIACLKFQVRSYEFHFEKLKWIQKVKLQTLASQSLQTDSLSAKLNKLWQEHLWLSQTVDFVIEAWTRTIDVHREILSRILRGMEFPETELATSHLFQWTRDILLAYLEAQKNLKEQNCSTSGSKAETIQLSTQPSHNPGFLHSVARRSESLTRNIFAS